MRRLLPLRRLAVAVSILVITFLLSASQRALLEEDSSGVKTEKRQLLSTGPSSEPATDSLDTIFGVYESRLGGLDSILFHRQIRILVPYSKTLFFLNGKEGKGMVYEAGEMFEQYVRDKTGVPVSVVIIPVRRDKLLTSLNDGYGDIVAANLTITEKRQQMVAFSAPLYGKAVECLVTGPAFGPIDSLEELAGKKVCVRGSSSFYEHLGDLNEEFKKQMKDTVGVELVSEYLEDEDILELVAEGRFPATIVDDNVGRFWAQLLPELQVHDQIRIKERGRIGWAIRKDSPKLKKALNEFINKNRKGTLIGNVLFDRYLRDTQYVRQMPGQELEQFTETLDLFKKYAEIYQFDWLMIAAQSYQESRLEQEAVSHAGAVGIMQIRPGTARDPQVNLPDIHQLEENIHAGIKYLRFLFDRYYKEEPMDDLNKYLFVLAAYNAGPATIRKMRRLAKKEGLNPNIWFNHVERVTAANVGLEPVKYVDHIYNNYLTLRYIDKYLLAKQAQPRI